MFEDLAPLLKTDWSKYGPNGVNELAQCLAKLLGDRTDLVHRGTQTIDTQLTQYPLRAGLKINANAGGRRWPDEGTPCAIDIEDPNGGIVRLNTPVFSQLYARITSTTLSQAAGMAYVQAIELPNGPTQPGVTGRSIDLYVGAAGFEPTLAEGQLVTYQYDFEGRATFAGAGSTAMTLYYLQEALAAGSPESPTGPVDALEYSCNGSTWSLNGQTRSMYNVMPCAFDPGVVVGWRSGGCPDRYNVLFSCNGVGSEVELDVLLACPTHSGTTISFPRATITIPGGVVTAVAPCTIDTCCASTSPAGSSSGGGGSSSGASSSGSSSGASSSYGPFESPYSSWVSGSSSACYPSGLVDSPICQSGSGSPYSSGRCNQLYPTLRVRFGDVADGTCSYCEEALRHPCGHLLYWSDANQRWEGVLTCPVCDPAETGRAIRLELHSNCPTASTICPSPSWPPCYAYLDPDGFGCDVSYWGDVYTNLFFDVFDQDPANYKFRTIAILSVQLGTGGSPIGWPFFGALLGADPGFDTHACNAVTFNCDQIATVGTCLNQSNFRYVGTLPGGLGAQPTRCLFGDYAQVTPA